ncbi:hypothetical protein V8E51_012040 [Hyaloscypha variabilis]
MTTSQTQSAGLPRLAHRVRAFHTKSSDGCKTCRIRRIRCDKAKPACKKCSTTGRKCDGYPHSSSGSEGSSRSLTPSTEHSSSSPPALPISTNILETDQERRSFSYFCRHTFPQLSGSFDTDDFWQRLLQATHHEPAIRHAAVALGALHEIYEAIPNTDFAFTLSERKAHDVFAMQQYSKAIKALLGSSGGKEQAVDIALVTCVLFIYFEILRGHHATALSHINGGIKILSSFHPTPSPSASASPSTPFSSPISQSSNPYVSTPTLILLFIRFDTQASSIIANRPRILLSPDLDNPLSGYTPEIPSEFRNLEEARNSLDYIRTEALRMMDTVDRKDWVKVKIMLACVQSTAGLRLELWERAFEALISRRENGGKKRSHIQGRLTTKEADKDWNDAVAVLKIQRIFMSFFFCVDLERTVRDESIWDEYTEDFSTIIALSESVIGPPPPLTQPPKRILSLDAGIVLPLYFVATKCRLSPLRWQAIALLRRTERQEGLCNSILTALVAEKLVRIEEEGMVDGRIGMKERVRGVELRFKVEERRASLRYARLEKGTFGRPPQGEVEWIDGWISW